VLRNQMTPLIIDSRVVLFRNILTPGRHILTPGHSVRVRARVRVKGQFILGVKIFRDTGLCCLAKSGPLIKTRTNSATARPGRRPKKNGQTGSDHEKEHAHYDVTRSLPLIK